jgi:hypothetical protein
MPGSAENLLKRTDYQIQASHERCIAASRSISRSTEIIASTRESIIRSHRQIAGLHTGQAAEDYPSPLLGPANR